MNLKNIISSSIAALTVLNSTPILNAHSQNSDSEKLTPILADLQILKAAGIPIMYKDEESQVGYAIVTGAAENRISQLAHSRGRCGNYEALPQIPQNINEIQNQFLALNALNKKNYMLSFAEPIQRQENPEITSALNELKADNIRETVMFLSSFKSRYNKLSDPNQHIGPFIQKLQDITKNATFPVSIETVDHTSTKQKSIKLTIRGSERPDEVIVLGAHLDSINGWGNQSAKAPGADDNASGSSSLVEALRVISLQKQPQRTLEFYWYAGEESGLLGSAEIAESSKNAQKNVIAVLQLDMTMFPGDGEGIIASINDFTSAWLRDYLVSINQIYIHATIKDDKCGYGCSDHASWYRRGYPTLMPTEARFNSMFNDIHTDRDIVSPIMSFNHALLFSKIAYVLAMDLGNSQLSQPNY
ncbi:MAG: M28 family peptidase [Pseudobdellovibrio sp.]